MKRRFYDGKMLKKIRKQMLREKVDYEFECPSCGVSVKPGFKKDNAWKYCFNCKKVLISDFEKVEIEKEIQEAPKEEIKETQNTEELL